MNQVGIDISNAVFDATMQHGSHVVRKQFSNTKTGHRQFIRWALYQASSARVCLEATGIYHLQLALALDRHTDIELMVVNPCAARRFAQAHMVRAKTDAIDADGLLQYLQRMEFRPWSAPREEILQLQSLAHRVGQLDKEVIRERSRLHAVRRAGSHTRLVQQDIQAHIAQLQRRLVRMRAQAYQVVHNDPQLADDARFVVSAPGFAELSATKLLAELSSLPDDMTPAQWVAHAGLDPRPCESGSSQRSPRRISKQGNVRIRRALFMPALVAIQRDANVSAFYEKLLENGKAKLQAITAVMRKLLHALWGMLHHRQEWDGEKFYRLNQPITA
jgi:transposase